MKIAVVGTGYVGLVTGTCLAQVGHAVTCIDIDAAKVTRMQSGEVPIYEPGLPELYATCLSSGRLSVTTDLARGIEGAEAIFLALPTPSGADGSADLSAVLAVAKQLGGLLDRYTIIINKSTVPVGTGEQVAARLAASLPPDASFDIVSNPEFLREGLAVEDCLHPDRVVIGSGSGSPEVREVMHRIYRPFFQTDEETDSKLVWMDIRSAEMTKYAANSFLAMKVSFMNEIANLCELTGANVDDVRLGIGPDQRIGSKFLYAGIGFGGSCFPKDVQALLHTATDYEYDFKLLRGIIEVNSLQKRRMTSKLLVHYDGNVKDRHFAVWGLAFKPDTDDIREAPALEIISQLLAHGATVTGYDPAARTNAERHFAGQPGISFAASAMEAAKGAEALLITTEWQEFYQPDYNQLKQTMAQPLIFDGRNLYDPAVMLTNGFEYQSIGRPTKK